ncbi:unnamed protein product [marine sediment metagenome]|uniref:Protein-export protein SecB n=1 Tax=marine sediment metagenome TaxID=412755 RepID=X0TYV0_9ZZZZ
MTEQIFEIKQIYVKNSSFETFNTPQLSHDKWQPKITFQIETNNADLEEENHYEVTLTTTVKAQVAEKDAYTAKVIQGGIFHIAGFDEEQKKHLLGAYCQNLLYPHACRILSELVTSGNLPPVRLQPIDFDVVYRQQQKDNNQEKNE